MNTNFVITIGRELGSGGKAIGEIIAQALNVPLYDSHLITLAAKESGLNPKVFEKADEVTNKGFLATVARGITAPFTSLENFYGNSISTVRALTEHDIIVNYDPTLAQDAEESE